MSFKYLFMYEIYACLALCLTHYYSISAGLIKRVARWRLNLTITIGLVAAVLFPCLLSLSLLILTPTQTNST